MENKATKRTVVIISYFFPPDKTPANRVLSWLKFLPSYGIYPIVLTKAHQGNPGIEKLANGEIHRIESPPIHSQRLALKKWPTAVKVLVSKTYHLTLGLSKYDKTYIRFQEYFDTHLKNSCDTLVITGSPFVLFRIGYHYALNSSGKWIADYRDMWHLSEMPRVLENWIEDGFRKIIGLRIERKWINTAKMISVSSTHFVKKMKSITQLGIKTIENGYFEEEYSNLNEKKHEQLSFVYVGTIYKTQKIEECIEIINEACKQENYKAKFTFIGSGFSRPLREFIKSLRDDHLEIEIIPRVKKEECLRIQNKSHIGIMSSYGIKGIPSSKLYEFLGMRQAVFLYPTDQDIIERILTSSGLGMCPKNKEIAVKDLRTTIERFRITKKISMDVNEEYIKSYTRKNLAKEFRDKVLNF